MSEVFSAFGLETSLKLRKNFDDFHWNVSTSIKTLYTRNYIF